MNFYGDNGVMNLLWCIPTIQEWEILFCLLPFLLYDVINHILWIEENINIFNKKKTNSLNNFKIRYYLSVFPKLIHWLFKYKCDKGEKEKLIYNHQLWGITK